MLNATRALFVLLAIVLAGEVHAQQDPEEAARRTATEEERAADSEAHNFEAEMREAERRLDEAARVIAELSTRHLPRIEADRFSIHSAGRPMLGITIDGDSESGPMEGVRISGITPGGPAFEAGLQAGDLLTAINEEPLSAESSQAANRKLLEFMEGVEEGDTLDIEYLRDGKLASASLMPIVSAARAYAFGFPGVRTARVPPLPTPPRVLDFNDFVMFHGQGGWGDLELVSLTEQLGRYFGTDKGLLVVRAPADDNLKLQDGDVIHSIDGREPTSVSHAVRILGSYLAGESLKLNIMRDKRRQTLEIEIPDNRSSGLARPPPVPAVQPGVEVRRVTRIVED